MVRWTSRIWLMAALDPAADLLTNAMSCGQSLMPFLIPRAGAEKCIFRGEADTAHMVEHAKVAVAGF